MSTVTNWTCKHKDLIRLCQKSPQSLRYTPTTHVFNLYLQSNILNTRKSFSRRVTPFMMCNITCVTVSLTLTLTTVRRMLGYTNDQQLHH